MPCQFYPSQIPDRRDAAGRVRDIAEVTHPMSPTVAAPWRYGGEDFLAFNSGGGCDALAAITSFNESTGRTSARWRTCGQSFFDTPPTRTARLRMSVSWLFFPTTAAPMLVCVPGVARGRRTRR